MDEDDEEEDDDDAESVEEFEQPDPAVILANKRAHPAFGPMLRSKGFFWLATRPFQFGEWSHAGGMLTVGCGGPWYAEVPKEVWPDDKDVRQSIENDFKGPWGDRRQELVVIGVGVDTTKITAAFDECLLDDADMSKWEGIMKNEKLSREEKEEKMAKVWEDGWEPWPDLEVEEDHEHDGNEEDAGEQKPKRRISEHVGHHHHKNGHSHNHRKMNGA